MLGEDVHMFDFSLSHLYLSHPHMRLFNTHTTCKHTMIQVITTTYKRRMVYFLLMILSIPHMVYAQRPLPSVEKILTTQQRKQLQQQINQQTCLIRKQETLPKKIHKIGNTTTWSHAIQLAHHLKSHLYQTQLYQQVHSSIDARGSGSTIPTMRR